MPKHAIIGFFILLVLCSCRFLTNDYGVIFYDDFSNPDSGWNVGANEDTSVMYQKGEYVFSFYKYDVETWGWSDDLSDVSDVSIQFKVKNHQGSPFYKFGIYCNYVDDKNHYTLLISTNGYYQITKVIDGTRTVLTPLDQGDWARGDVPTQAVLYKYRAECAKGTLSLFVNGDEIATINDTSLTQGGIRLHGGYFGHEIGEIHFDDFEVKRKR